MRLQRATLIGVFSFAVALRIAAVLRFPFEQDELYTVDEAGRLFGTHLLPGIQARPLFFLLEHPFVTGFPVSQLSLRFLALVFGVAGMIVAWWLITKVLGKRAAFSGLVMLAVSPWHLYASAFARYYSMLFMLAAAVYWLLPRAYDSDRRNDYLGALVALYVGCWTHPSFVFPVAGAVLAISIVGRDGVIRWRWPSRNAWLWLWVPLILASLVTAVTIRLIHGSAAVDNGGDRGLLATLRLIPAMVDWMTLTVAAASVAGLVLLLQSDDTGRRRLGAMTLSASILTIVALFALSFRTAIYADYGISALPLLIATAAYVPAWMLEQVSPARRNAAYVTVLFILVVSSIPGTLSFMSDGNRFDYRPAFAKIEQTSPRTLALVWPKVLQVQYAPALDAQELPASAARLDSILSSRRDLWAVISVKQYGIVGDDTGEMVNWLSAHCREAGTYQRPRLDYRVYRVNLWRCTSPS